jgi:hypothetical protein
MSQNDGVLSLIHSICDTVNTECVSYQRISRRLEGFIIFKNFIGIHNVPSQYN